MDSFDQQPAIAAQLLAQAEQYGDEPGRTALHQELRASARAQAVQAAVAADVGKRFETLEDAARNIADSQASRAAVVAEVGKRFEALEAGAKSIAAMANLWLRRLVGDGLCDDDVPDRAVVAALGDLWLFYALPSPHGWREKVQDNRARLRADRTVLARFLDIDINDDDHGQSGWADDDDEPRANLPASARMRRHLKILDRRLNAQVETDDELARRQAALVEVTAACLLEMKKRDRLTSATRSPGVANGTIEPPPPSDDRMADRPDAPAKGAPDMAGPRPGEVLVPSDSLDSASTERATGVGDMEDKPIPDKAPPDSPDSRLDDVLKILGNIDGRLSKIDARLATLEQKVSDPGVGMGEAEPVEPRAAGKRGLRQAKR